MTASEQVFVALLNEGNAEVWRQSLPRLLVENSVLGSIPQDESWEFTPGVELRCKEHTFADGKRGLVAYEVAL